MCTTLVYNTCSILVHQLCRHYLAEKSGDSFIAPFRYFVTLDDQSGAVNVIPLGTNEWEDALDAQLEPPSSEEPPLA